MSRDRKILLVVEGAKAEPALINRLLEVYGIKDVERIYPYQANVYDLYRRMFRGHDDVEDLSLKLVLREKERDPAKRALLDEDYSDTILVFVFDPQDHLFSSEHLAEMVDYFDESTDHGKLYVNYPMVEAYRDFTIAPYDENYPNRTVGLSELKRGSYKAIVDGRSRMPQLSECNVTMFDQILIQNIEKASLVIGCEYVESDPALSFGDLSQDSILQAETDLLDAEDVVSVLCTCLWFVIDYRPRAMRRYLQSVASRG